MGDNENSGILARIEERLAALGKTERAASLEATGAAHAIRNMRKGSKPNVELFSKLAPALDTTPEYLAFGVKGATAPAAELSRSSWPPMASIPVIGQVAAGLWLEVDTDVDAPLYDAVPVPPDPAYAIEHQFAVEVVGTSVNRVAPDGSILGCVDIDKARIGYKHNDLVIVEQRRNGGMEVMRTAKRYRVNGDVFELWPDSTDPKWTKPIVVDPDEEAEEGSSIKVVGIVTWVHAPLSRLDRSRQP